MRTVVFLVICALSGCGLKAAQVEHDAYETKKAQLEGTERAINEQAMKDHPTAGITPDMGSDERETKIARDTIKQMNEGMAKANAYMNQVSEAERRGDKNLPPMPDLLPKN